MKNKKKVKYNMNLTKLYVASFSVFIAGFLFIFVSPMFTGGSYSYVEATPNEFQTLSNSLRIAVVKKEYNPEKEFMRLDFSVEETSSDSSLQNIKYEVMSQYIKGKEPLKYEINKVTDNYFVLIIKDLPKGFSVLSTQISPAYIHPELEDENNLEDRSVKFYVNETPENENVKLKIGTEKEYKEEYITFEQEIVKEKIKEFEAEVEKNSLEVTELNSLISQLESELMYQTNEEKLETKNKISGHETTINRNEEENNELKNNINELKEKIKLLEEKRKNL